MSILLLSVGLTYAASYIYDGNGRVIAVTRSDGATGQYVYDVMGNLQKIVSVPANHLAVFGFAPNHGSPGNSVTIYGQGFSATAANNVVKFNGSAAAVASATATSLTATVPAAATSGPVSVTVGSNTATSTDNFVIDGTGQPPVITSFSPSVVSAGTAVTLMGAHLDPVDGQTSVAVDGEAVSPSSVADTQIAFPAPNHAGSGPISVETPYGLAVSDSYLMVTPSGISPTQVTTKNRLSVGGTQSLTIPAGTYGALLFQASANGWMSLQLTSLTTSAKTITYRIYDPQNQLLRSSTISATSPSVHLPRLRYAGVYTVYFEPDTAAATLSVGLEQDPVLAPDGGWTTLATTVPNQSERGVFPVSAGQNLYIAVNSDTTVPSGNTVSLNVYGPVGESAGTSNYQNPPGINLSAASFNGTYEAIVSANSGAMGTFSVGVRSAPTASLGIDGASQAVSLLSGEWSSLNFSAAAGDNLELGISGMVGSYGIATVTVYDASGTSVKSTSCYAGSPGAGCHLSLWGLAGGDYRVAVTNQAMTGYSATLTRDLVDTLSIGKGVTEALARPGQTARLTFSATAGDTLGIAVSGRTTTPTGAEGYLIVYNPDGSQYSQTDLFDTGDVANLPNLPQTGTYTAIFEGAYGTPTSATLTLLAGSTATLTTNGASQSLTTAAYQAAYLHFTAAAGDNLELGLSGLTGSSGSYASVNVYDASGKSVNSNACFVSNPAGSCVVALPGLAGGDYKAIVTSQGTTGFSATLTKDLVGTLTADQGVAVSLTKPGQTARLKFTANAGQSLAIAVTGRTTDPVNNYSYLYVYNPDGTLLSQTTLFDTDDTVNIPNLTQSGTYTALYRGYYGLPSSATLKLVSDATGTLTTDGSSQTLSTADGQAAYLSFSAAAGDNLELGLSGLTGTSSGYATVGVYDANNNSIGSQTCYTDNPAGTCHVALWKLAGGTYKITVLSHGTTGFAATLTRDLTGTLVPGQALSVMLTRPGQTARLTFNATIGQTATLSLAGLGTTPSGNFIYVNAYNPDGSSLKQSTLFSTSGTVSLPGLATAGTYTVIFYGSYGLPTSGNVTLQLQ